MNGTMKAFLSLVVVLVPATAAADKKPTVLDCAKQPQVAINKAKGTYKITGTCKSVSVSGGDNTLSIEAVTSLSVTGKGNVITVGKADKIATLGAANRVTYGSGLTGTLPAISTVGSNSVVAATSSPVAVNVTVGTSATVSSSMIDCAKQPTHSISSNDGSYTFVGTCQLISIDGNDNNLTIASAKTISITGNNNNVSVTSVDKLAVPGNDNNVSWKKGLKSTKAKISVVGNDNKVSRSK